MKDIREILSPMGAEVSIIPVLQGDGTMKVNEAELPDSLPILALRNAVLFPGTVYPITIGREKSIKLIEDAERRGTYIGAVPQLDVTVEDPQKEDLYGYGTVAKIIKTLEMPDGTLTAILQGFTRFGLDAIMEYDPYILGKVHYLHDTVPESNDNNIRMIIESLKEKATTILKYSSFVPREALLALKSIDNFEFLVNFIATTIEVDNFFDKVELLEYADLKTRAMKLLAVLDTQIELLKIKQDINQKVKSEIDQQQREYYLNNQLRTIQEELGMDDTEDFDRFRKKAEEKIWPASVQEIFEKEMAKLEIIVAEKGLKRVTPELVEENVGISKEYNNYELQRAIAAKDVLKANRIIQYFGKDPKNNPVQLTLIVLFNYFSNLLICYYTKDRSESGLMAALGLRGNFQLKDYLAGMKNYPPMKVFALIGDIRMADAQSKGVGNSSASAPEILKTLVYKILH